MLRNAGQIGEPEVHLAGILLFGEFEYFCWSHVAS
jgi:hypothetical protein